MREEKTTRRRGCRNEHALRLAGFDKGKIRCTVSCHFRSLDGNTGSAAAVPIGSILAPHTACSTSNIEHKRFSKTSRAQVSVIATSANKARKSVSQGLRSLRRYSFHRFAQQANFPENDKKILRVGMHIVRARGWHKNTYYQENRFLELFACRSTNRRRHLETTQNSKSKTFPPGGSAGLLMDARPVIDPPRRSYSASTKKVSQNRKQKGGGDYLCCT